MTIKLSNVRLSFPQLFVPKSVQEGGEAKYSASFLLDKKNDAAQIDTVRKAIASVATEKWGAKVPASLKKCLHEGTEKSYDGYGEENMFLSTSATIRPTVVDRNRAPLTADDGRPYAGCMVNVVVRMWAQDNQFGKRINAQLQGVQFAADGEAFGAAPFNAEEHFSSDDGSGDDSAPPATPPAKSAAPASGPAVSAKSRLKSRFRAHPDFGTKLKSDDVNDYMVRNFEHKLDDLTEGEAENCLENFDQILAHCLDSIPF